MGRTPGVRAGVTPRDPKAGSDDAGSLGRAGGRGGIGEGSGRQSERLRGQQQRPAATAGNSDDDTSSGGGLLAAADAVAAVVIMACRRTDYLKRTMASILSRLPASDRPRFPLFISQDGTDGGVRALALGYGKSDGVGYLNHIEERPPVPEHANDNLAYYRIAEHYKCVVPPACLPC